MFLFPRCFFPQVCRVWRCIGLLFLFRLDYAKRMSHLPPETVLILRRSRFCFRGGTRRASITCTFATIRTHNTQMPIGIGVGHGRVARPIAKRRAGLLGGIAALDGGLTTRELWRDPVPRNLPAWRVGHITSGRYHRVCVGALTETKTGVPDVSRFSRSRPLAANAQAGVFKLFSTPWPTPRS